MVRFHPNGKYIATGSRDHTSRLWDIQNGQCVRLLTGNKVCVCVYVCVCVCVGGGGRRIAKREEGWREGYLEWM